MAKLTPVMQQHADAKQENPDCIIFFRLGDFYEMFGDDAVVVARELDLTLTSRNRGKPDEIPMAGVPHHSAHGYIARLMKKGFKVAICEQMADPKTIKGIVPRQVVRVVTPGTWTDSPDLEPAQNQWLCSIAEGDDALAIAFLDLTTSELLATEVSDRATILSELSRARPLEILLQPGSDLGEAISELSFGATLRPAPEGVDVAKVLQGIATEGLDGPALVAAAFCLQFARECYREKTFPVWKIATLNPSRILGLDLSAQRHLELVESTVGEKRATLFHVINKTETPMGARLLRRRLLAPLLDEVEIERRLDEVEGFFEHHGLRAALKKELSRFSDLERLSVRASLFELSPKELGRIRSALAAGRAAYEVLAGLEHSRACAALHLSTPPDFCDEFAQLLAAALVEDPPATAAAGAVFLPGFDAELDGYAQLRSSGAESIAAFEEELRASTKISNLKVKSTRVFGWYVEVPRSQLDKVPASFRRKQTVATGERYTLDELDSLAEEIESAEENFRARELELLRELYDAAAAVAQKLHLLAARVAAIDVASALAEVAVEYGYCRPQVDTGDQLLIEEGRHPVVERLAAAGCFVPNDVSLKARGAHFWLISGPNMAGKSTFLRQVALIAILAQMGSYVPARKAHIGMVDRVLSRVGASDNLAFGESTFMVEMRETAEILRLATSRSLVILDEVGRGTSTFDGLSIAWAVAEHLDQMIRCRSLFATHYHELAELADKSASASNHSVSAREHEGEIVFLHRVEAGAASRSYGVEVARLAGLPEGVLSRARGLLQSFEAEGQSSGQNPKPAAQGELFAAPQRGRAESEALSTLRELDAERMTSLEALQLLMKLQQRLKP